MSRKFILLPIAVLLLWLCPNEALAQKITLTGKVTEKTNGEALPGATAVLLNPKDSTQVTGAATNTSGWFTISPKKGGKYKWSLKSFLFI